MTKTSEEILDTDEFDDLIRQNVPTEQLVGRRVRWHGGPVLRAVELANNDVGLRIRLHCARCGRRTRTVYLISGCHYGAFCYAADRHGNDLADLRNQEYVCHHCSHGSPR